MYASEVVSISKDIALWSEPLISDYIYAAYGRCFGGELGAAETLVRHHCRLWRALFDKELVVAGYLRRELLKAFAAQRLTRETLDAIDIGVCDHLLDVIMRRSQRSRDTARCDAMTLVHAASMLGEIRRAA